LSDPLYAFFHPRGVAVIGASSDPTKLSHGVMRNLLTHGYRGPVYPLSEETKTRLREICPPGTMVGNPVDMLGGPQPDRYTAALELLLAAPEVDGVMVIYVPQAITPRHDVAVAVARAAEGAGKPARGVEKPVVCCISGGGYLCCRPCPSHSRRAPLSDALSRRFWPGDAVAVQGDACPTPSRARAGARSGPGACDRDAAPGGPVDGRSSPGGGSGSEPPDRRAIWDRSLGGGRAGRDRK
jgi:hypothetical protein